MLLLLREHLQRTGFTREYSPRVSGRAARERFKPGARDWFLLSGRLVGQRLRPQNWPSNFGFGRAATDFGKAIGSGARSWRRTPRRCRRQ